MMARVPLPRAKGLHFKVKKAAGRAGSLIFTG